MSTGQLNRFLSDALRRNPPPTNKKHQQRRLKILYATAAVGERYAAIPVPLYILFVNDKRLLTDSYSQYLENTLRKHKPSPGLPINFSVRSRRKPVRD
jgi:GTP-binding protein